MDSSKEYPDLDVLSQLLSFIIHELKAPLGIMASDISIIKVRYAADPTLSKDLKRLEEQMQRIFEMTSAISFLGRVPDNARLRKTAVSEVLNDVIRRLRRRFDNDTITFRLSAGRVFAMAEPYLLEHTLERLLLNFANNIHATERQPSVVHISVGVTPQSANTIVIRITDSNRVLGQKAQFDLSDLFLVQYPGQRLDLFSVERTIQLHNGSTTVGRGANNVGATLSVFLPRG